MADPDTTAMVAVRNILTRLCKRSGLSPERLRTTEIDVNPLLELPTIRRHAQHTGLPPHQAVLPVIRNLARQLPPTHQLITDAELSLGLLRDNPPDGIDLNRLYAHDLGERREYLTTHWHPLHEALHADHIPAAPTVRSLRATPERRAFTALAALLTSPPTYNATPRLGETIHTAPGTLTVIGDAVIDHIYRVDHIPPHGTSTPGRFIQHPGGKGLNRAVAAARLGLDVRFVTAVGDDDNGHRILDYLHSENIDTRLIKIIPHTTTPVTAVIVTPTGESSAISCKDDRVQLHEHDLTDPDIHSAITDTDAVLLTFEQPPAVIDTTMYTIRGLPQRPLVLVHTAPPVSAPQYLYKHLGIVDYMMGSTRELDLMVPEVAATSGPHIAQQLRILGVRTVCVIEGFACTARSDRLDVDIPRYNDAVLSDSPGAGAAFSAALAYRLLTTRRPADEKDYAWATAAMVATQSFGDVPNAMPLATDIDRIVTLASQQQ
ncbi:hypothetical protein B0T36_21740 [Nocardia donostiensis]|uniref:carbohydrate kinase family protein n=1 Tax=Nocardia donostiensis TaxID=1538463 RepID=UPI0009D9C541|nr:PfkB family carbohydrate kinase [Nocardia donostiensis]OQS13163.1 hypothetical protein B0T36_21740 [Nocardia donostiensis]